MTPTAPDASTEAATSDLEGQAGEAALKASSQNLPPKFEEPSDTFSVSPDEDKLATDTVAHKATKSKSATKDPSAPGQTINPNGPDDVHMSKLVFDARMRKSLSVKHLQRRLNDLGYDEANADIDGWAGALTQSSVHKWQSDNGYPEGPLKVEQAKALFKGDRNVNLVLDTVEL